MYFYLWNQWQILPEKSLFYFSFLFPLFLDYGKIKAKSGVKGRRIREFFLVTVKDRHLTGSMLLHDNIWNALHEARPC